MALVSGTRTTRLGPHVHAAWSDASRGDLRPTGHGRDDGAPLAGLTVDLAAATGARLDEVAWVTQVHGTGVAVVDAPTGASVAGGVTCRHLGAFDALVATGPGTALCVLTADCAPIALASPEGVIGAVHAGWRGLVDGVVEATVAAMRDRGATEVTAALGPCIHAPCYEFSPEDLATVEAVYGPTVRGTTTAGTPALDLPAGVAAAVAAAGARMIQGPDLCTACADGQFSHRARADTGRQALLVWSTHPGARW